jgi:hypothetical protein
MHKRRSSARRNAPNARGGIREDERLDGRPRWRLARGRAYPPCCGDRPRRGRRTEYACSTNSQPGCHGKSEFALGGWSLDSPASAMWGLPPTHSRHVASGMLSVHRSLMALSRHRRLGERPLCAHKRSLPRGQLLTQLGHWCASVLVRNSRFLHMKSTHPQGARRVESFAFGG